MTDTVIDRRSVSAPATDERFARRHIGPEAHERDQMLATLGLETLEEMVDEALPRAIRRTTPLDLPPALSETELRSRLRSLAERNEPGRAMIGLGYHGTVTPAVIRRNVLESPAWYTAYTPYQPEISQGRLEALLNFQTMVSDLTGLPTAGASLLDEATAVAEAVALARRSVRGGSVVVMDSDTLPQTLSVVRTRAAALGIEVIVAAGDLAQTVAEVDPFAVVVQTPGASGRLPSAEDLDAVVAAARAKNAVVIAGCDLLALTLVRPPGEWGADIAVGSSQRFGVPLFYGGPHAAFIAVRAGLERSLPGRLVGVSKDVHGAAAFRLALQTREQHIRREKATSNICTAQVLLAVVASMYAVYHGPRGLHRIAGSVHRSATQVAGALDAAGVHVVHRTFFDTLLLDVPGRAAEIVARARRSGLHLRQVGENQVGVAIGEDATAADLVSVCDAFGAAFPAAGEYGELAGGARTTPFLTHPVFNTHHSETALLRYLRALSDRDFALDRGMIPLGSCTMKLNATTELEPISLPGFADLHPFVPAPDAAGYRELIDELEHWLAELTGYAAVSVQPNAGSQGELAGLLAISAYHRSQGQPERQICLIPSSAHGTNAASAVMAGMRVVVVRAAPDGSVDLDDLRAKLDAHSGQVAAAMVTYPSTHGVFEEGIADLCTLVHAAGGQVYVDGANLNALLGLAQPGAFGADVSHLNLHKTFCIPHGGGGPGVGPVAVAAHLAPYLPTRDVLTPADSAGVGPVSAAPYGSAGILPISYAYIAMMGSEGLTEATQHALLAANYVAERLRPSYPVLYSGRAGRVAHECILDLRPITKATGITVDDVAKRLIDYGFHAPTMSFPVAGTLMIEPTESENLEEIDRFCTAMIQIRDEISRVEAGEWPSDDNPLVNAPHTHVHLTDDEWTHPYGRRVAAFPAGLHTGPLYADGFDKYWPPVGRIDGAFGDRNLVCTCPPVDSYA